MTAKTTTDHRHRSRTATALLILTAILSLASALLSYPALLAVAFVLYLSAGWMDRRAEREW